MPKSAEEKLLDKLEKAVKDLKINGNNKLQYRIKRTKKTLNLSIKVNNVPEPNGELAIMPFLFLI